MDVKKITYAQSKKMILNNHYAHRMPSISWAFGLYDNGVLRDVVTYGKPASNYLCIGVLLLERITIKIDNKERKC